jgi:hypothetical protein
VEGWTDLKKSIVVGVCLCARGDYEEMVVGVGVVAIELFVARRLVLV